MDRPGAEYLGAIAWLPETDASARFASRQLRYEQDRAEIKSIADTAAIVGSTGSILPRLSGIAGRSIRIPTA